MPHETNQTIDPKSILYDELRSFVASRSVDTSDKLDDGWNLENKSVNPIEWFVSLGLDFDARIESPMSLHLEYQEATCEFMKFDDTVMFAIKQPGLVNGDTQESAITGGHALGFTAFESGPYDWNEETIKIPLQTYCSLLVTLRSYLKYSTIEPQRVTQLLDTLLNTLHYDLERFDPDAVPVYTVSEILHFETHLHCLRDHKETLPSEDFLQRVYSDDVVMMQ